MLVRVPLRPGVYVMMEQEQAIRLGYVKAAQPVDNKMVKPVRNKRRTADAQDDADKRR